MPHPANGILKRIHQHHLTTNNLERCLENNQHRLINYIKTNQMRLHPLNVLGYMAAAVILISMLTLGSCKHDNEWEEMKAV